MTTSTELTQQSLQSAQSDAGERRTTQGSVSVLSTDTVSFTGTQAMLQSIQGDLLPFRITDQTLSVLISLEGPPRRNVTLVLS